MQRLLILYIVTFLVSFLTFPLTLERKLSEFYTLGTLYCDYTDEGRIDAFHQRNQDALDSF